MHTMLPTAQVACVEVGGGGLETVLLGPDGAVIQADGLAVPQGVPLLIAVPGLVSGGRVIAASNLGWFDVDPAQQLGLNGPAVVVCNDAEAAALGESALRDGEPDLVFLGLGTGVGGAVVIGGEATANLFAHTRGFSRLTCTCGRTGCLETVAAGWALPDPLEPSTLSAMAEALAGAVQREPRATPELVVLAGGITARHPQLIPLLHDLLPGRVIEGTAAPGTKSAAAWGLRQLLLRRAAA